MNQTYQTYYYNFLTGALVVPDHWQMKIRKGTYYEIVLESPYPMIYGVILDITQERGYFWVRAYSTWCPDGEEGMLCIVEPTRMLTKREFVRAQQRRWKTEEQSVERINSPIRRKAGK
jgi:hypothetical protein